MCLYVQSWTLIFLLCLVLSQVPYPFMNKCLLCYSLLATHTIPHIARLSKLCEVREILVVKNVLVHKRMCLMSLAAATVVCLGWAQEKVRYLSWATIVTTIKETEKDKDKTQKTKKKATPLLQDAWQQNAFSTCRRAWPQSVLNKAAVPLSAHCFFLIWWNLIAERKQPSSPSVYAAWPLPLQFNR